MSFYKFYYGYIYKITNILNGDSYIGQVYNKSIEERWKRHIKSSEDKNNKSHISRALRKYGSNNFKIEKIEDAYSVEDINNKEKYWIKHYKNLGINLYNETDGGEGGNTYKYKTEKEIQLIKDKISKSNSGKNNGLSKQIKALDIETNKIYHFDTLGRCLKFLGIKNKGGVSNICGGTVKYYWRNKWNFAYEGEEFKKLTIKHPRISKYNIKKGKLIRKSDKQQIIFNSKYAATIYLKNNNLNKNDYEKEYYDKKN